MLVSTYKEPVAAVSEPYVEPETPSVKVAEPVYVPDASVSEDQVSTSKKISRIMQTIQ